MSRGRIEVDMATPPAPLGCAASFGPAARHRVHLTERRRAATVYLRRACYSAPPRNGTVPLMKLFSQALLDELSAKAATSPRRRANLHIHASPVHLVHRLFVVAQQDSYFRPHRHLARSELALVIRGHFDVLTFDAGGAVNGRHR